MRAILRQHKQTGVNDMATMTDLVLKEQEAKLPDIKRNKSGTINGNSFTWWRHNTEQSLQVVCGLSEKEAVAMTRKIADDYYKGFKNV